MRSKYGVDRSEAGKRRRTFEGVVYDSQAEMAYAAQLQMRVHSGELLGFDRQVPIPLVVNFRPICKMVIDFKLIWPNGKTELHDVKGMVTRDWRIKAKLFEAIYGYPIVEVHNGVVKEAKKRKVGK